MFVLRLKIAVGLLTLILLFDSASGYQLWAVDPPGQSTTVVSDADETVGGVSADQFDKLRSLIKPKPGGFDDLLWMTELWEARKKAAKEGKPLLVWVGDGHPLGWT